MKTGRTDPGRKLEAALGEVLAHVRQETSLPCRIVDQQKQPMAAEVPPGTPGISAEQR